MRMKATIANLRKCFVPGEPAMTEDGLLAILRLAVYVIMTRNITKRSLF